MDADLIRREALKKAIDFNKICFDCPIVRGNDCDDCKMALIERLIDNAPTVEPFEPDYVGAERLKARQRGYEQGYHEGMKIGKTLNPKINQGEWIIADKVLDYYHECPFCHWQNEVTELLENFCPNCGADMRGEYNDVQ